MKELLSTEAAEGMAALVEIGTNPIAIGAAIIGGVAFGAHLAYKKFKSTSLPELVEDITDQAAKLANHGWQDPNYTPPTLEELLAEIEAEVGVLFYEGEEDPWDSELPTLPEPDVSIDWASLEAELSV